MSTTPATLSLTTAIVVPAPTEANALASTGDELASALRVARKTIPRMESERQAASGREDRRAKALMPGRDHRLAVGQRATAARLGGDATMIKLPAIA